MQTDESVEKPLRDLRVIEFEGIGPGPLAGRMLSDMGAHVTVVARPATSPVDRALIGEDTENPLRHGKEIIRINGGDAAVTTPWANRRPAEIQ